MSETPETAPTPVGFGDAFERLQAITSELGTEDTLAPDRMIALLREGAGLERALREHLDRVEQEVRSIEAGEGAQAFRIVDGEGAAEAPTSAPATPAPTPAPATPAPAPAATAAPAPKATPVPAAAPAGKPAPAPSSPPPAAGPGEDWGGEPVPPLDAGPDGGWAEEPTWDDGPPSAPTSPPRGTGSAAPTSAPRGGAPAERERRPLPPPPTDDELPF